MTDTQKPLLIKRYASRRLYNTETSDYVTLEDIAGFIRAGREVKIVDLKSGDDLTRQYLLQIVAEHESRGESVLPLGVLTDLVRSYSTQAQSVVPQFLAMSFEMLRDGQSKIVDNMTTLPNPMAAMPGFEAMQQQQKLFMKTMMSGWPVMPGDHTDTSDQTPGQASPQGAGAGAAKTDKSGPGDDLSDIKRQLSELEAKLAQLKK
ncbi:polyhydroxyalkanoate synthesis repressor PhaR [Roseicitreum antarcticum]|uniref:Polyhydroxyalkanoate synthesis repressor PhaR n=1 Tax=Roseicitreum antarcticum TaxID=564137 RepID=A0A1H2UBQ9_9RHOB|nr:polyhydroxyalkanoate synthesis repressor PhaR [Roseicitreum antarcticum]SDW53407.1 polyhydroxyalkanoate synthesis repressor PhaR [Roseicitreum antarcticum]